MILVVVAVLASILVAAPARAQDLSLVEDTAAAVAPAVDAATDAVETVAEPVRPSPYRSSRW